MTPEPERNLRLEIGHVLFVDIVGYSKLLIEEQKERLRQLTEIVLATAQVRESTNEQLVRLPTGDGMALVFRNSSEEPARCALEIAEALKAYSEVLVRMGIHSGPVSEVADVSGRTNIAGAGINMAQRVMDCGDAGHILLSKRVAEDLEQYGHWKARLHDLGECEVKHGVRLEVVNLCGDGVGNPQLPKRLKALKQHRNRIRWTGIAAALLLAIGGGFLWRFAGASHARGVTSAAAPAPVATPAVSTPLPIPEKSIAVLPFENLSANQENAFFTDGVQDEILTDLAKVADLKVISRTSVMQYKANVARNLPQIAQALKVANVLEGSVQRSENRVRVSAQLIDARTDTHIWAENYDRELSDVFQIQSEIAQAIADQLRAKLSPREKATIEERPTNDLAAYDLYLKARRLRDEYVLNQSHERENILEGIELLNQVVQRDPHFLSAICLLALGHDALYFNYDHTKQRRALAEAQIEAANKLRPDAGETYLARGIHYYMGYRDYQHAREELSRVQQLLPNDSMAPGFLAYIARREGRWDDAVRDMKRAVELDPNSWLLDLADIYLNLRRYEDAIQTYDRYLVLHPGQPLTRFRRALVDFDSSANLSPARAVLNQLEKENPAARAELAEYAFDLAARERDPAAAAREVATLSRQPRENLPFPTSFCEGWVARLRKDEPAARAAFVVARAEDEQLVHAQPENSLPLAMLAFIDASMGNKEKAIAEARAACALSPLDKDALDGAVQKTNLARVYALTGERDLALAELATVSKLPGGPSYGELKLGPEWDALRDDARFQSLLKSLAVDAQPAKQ